MRGLFIAIAFFGVAVPSAADAYCVLNHSKNTLRVKLDSYNPLGKWYRLVKPGTQVCCDWFDHVCNPGTSRDGLIYLQISARYGKPRFCSHNHRKQVKVTGDGRVVVTEDLSAIGALRCNSTDRMMRQVHSPGYKPAGKQLPRFTIPKSTREQEIDAKNRSSTAVEGVTPEGEAPPPKSQTPPPAPNR